MKHCLTGEPCALHGFIHGAEADELREELEKLVARGKVRTRDVRRVLDRVDARDSVAWAEVRARIEASQTPASPEDGK